MHPTPSHRTLFKNKIKTTLNKEDSKVECMNKYNRINAYLLDRTSFFLGLCVVMRNLDIAEFISAVYAREGRAGLPFLIGCEYLIAPGRVLVISGGVIERSILALGPNKGGGNTLRVALGVAMAE